VVDSKIYEIQNIYWDTDGNLRVGNSSRSRDDEVIAILENDNNGPVEDAETALWVVVPSRWLRKWLIFAHMKLGEEPGKIDTNMLLAKDPKAFNGYRPLMTLKPPNHLQDMNPQAAETPGHYRRIGLRAFEKLVELYGLSGPVICVRGFPFDDLYRWRVFPTVQDINIVSMYTTSVIVCFSNVRAFFLSFLLFQDEMPEPVLPEKPGEKKDEQAAAPKKTAVEGGMDTLKSLF